MTRGLWVRLAFAAGMILMLTQAVAVAAADGGELLARAEALTSQVLQLYNQARYAEAVPLAEEALATREKAVGREHSDVAGNLNILALLYSAQGRYAEAEPLYRRTLEIEERTLGPENVTLAAALNNLAELYRAQGRFTEAESPYRRSLAITEKTHGADHPIVATSLNNLAVLYDNQGRLVEAEPLYRRALEIREKALGPNHPDVAVSLNNLAGLYRAQERFGNAEQLYRRCLAIQENALGPDHPAISISLGNLALLYQDQGRYADAEPLYRRSLAIAEKVFGPEHRSVADILTNLATMLRLQGRIGEAEALFLRSLAIYENALGPNHPGIANSLNNLALLYSGQARYNEAESLDKRNLAIREKALGPDHPDVAMSLNNLAEIYREQGRYAEAEPLYRRFVAIQEKVFGRDHATVAIGLSNLGLLYQTQGRYAEAEPLFQRSLAIRENAFGPVDTNVALALNNLAMLYKDQGRYGDAERLIKRSIAIFDKVLGPDSPSLATGINNLSVLYLQQGRYAEAEALARRDLGIREKTLVPDHPDTATSLNNLGGVYDAQLRYAEAEPLYQRSLAIRMKVFGPDHPAIAAALNSLAVLYQKQGRYAEAEQIYVRSLEIKAKALGPDHPDVALALGNLGSMYNTMGRHTEAERVLLRSVAIFEKALGPDHPSVATSLNNLGYLRNVQGRYAEAETLFARVLAIKEKSLGPDHPDLAGSLGNMVGLYRAEHLPSKALPFSRRAVAIFSHRFARPDTSSAEKWQWQPAFWDDIALIDAVGDGGRDAVVAETFSIAQLAHASDAGKAVERMATRFAAGTGALAAIVRERQDLATYWKELDKRIVRAASLAPDQRAAADEARLRADFGAASKRMEALDRRIAAEFPEYVELSNPRPLSVPEVQALLGPDEALLMTLVAKDETWLWAIRRDRAALFRLDITAAALKQEVMALRSTLDPNLNPGWAPFPAGRAYVLHQKLLAPAAGLLDGSTHVLFVPDGALESLPLGVLVTRPPAADPVEREDHRAVAWFIRDHAVSVLPSVGSLRSLRRFSNRTKASLPFIGIGDPMLSGATGDVRGVKVAGLFRGGLADVDEIRHLPPLPETADELKAVAKVVGAKDSDLYMGLRATEPILRKAGLDRYQIIEFATHGLISGELKRLAEPALVLTPPAVATLEDDGLLTASKIATLSLDADWAVLSACNTAAADGSPDAGGLSGLAKAFFYAGARSLLVSHWNVASGAAVKLVTGAFAAQAKDPGIGRAEAVRRSMLAMMDDPSNPSYFAHPMAWAPFVLAGEGAPGR